MAKVLVSGVKPTGRPHIGNYFGAMKQFVDLQGSYDARIFAADLHALTSLQNAGELAQNTRNIVLDYLAIGLDPKKTLIYKQSDIPEVTELAWVFSCLTTVPYLERAHAVKDAREKGRELNAGTFGYPLLMAADILIHDADAVPVGKDQKQHLEIARDTAEKFNRTFGETFKLPEPLILEATETVPGTDGQKMSKSYGNTIPLFASDKEIETAVMGIVTDSEADIPENVYAIHKLIRSDSDLAPLYAEKKGQYKALKEALIADLKTLITPMRERRAELEKDADFVDGILATGKEKVRLIAQGKMNEVRERVGLKL